MGESIGSSQAVKFDLTTQPGVMQALYAIRTSDLNPAKKNSLRDQVFTYTKSGGDVRLREKIEGKLAEVPLSQAFLDVHQANAKTAAKPGFAGGRRAPSFSVPTVSQPATKEAAKSDPASTTSSTAVPTATNDSEPKPIPTPALTPTESKTPEPVPQSVAAQPQPAVAPVVTPSPVTPVTVDAVSVTEKKVPATTAPQAPATPDPIPTGAANAEAHSIERIREIKRYINNKIGNPVNLVDINNDLGRSYMSALLAAMQSVNAETGRAGANEMQELERIFTQVQPLLHEEASSTNATTESQSPATPTPAPIFSAPDAAPQETATTQSVSEPVPTSTTAPQSAPTPAPKPEVSAPAPTPKVESEPVPTPSAASVNPPTPAPEQTPAPTPKPTSVPEPTSAAPVVEPEVPVAPTPAPQPAPAAKTPPVETPNIAANQAKVSPVQSMGQVNKTTTHSTPHVPMPAVDATGKEADEDTEAVPMPTEAANPPQPARPPLGIGEVPAKSVPRDDVPDNLPGAAQPTTVNKYSVARETANNLSNQLTELDRKAAAANKNHGDPLHAPEIDAGLEQLLQEWNLFKSSGLFGTGPNGREHPLYQKLADMMIQDVAQGRFADARPEVTQSITDYMNGWRYEQGIVYEPGESFETYLRRVIRFIIDSKK